MSDSSEGGMELRGRRVGVFTRGLFRLPHLATFLGGPELVFSPRRGGEVDVVVGWGNKPTAERARLFAEQHERPYLRLEDGFFRSVRTGAKTPTLSLCVDDVGIYYDARSPSRLENLLSAGHGGTSPDPLADEALLGRARSLIARVRASGVSKYNESGFSLPVSVGAAPGERILVVDQTYGDAAVGAGLASSESFAAMLEAALDESPGATVFVKTHPEVVEGRKKGYLGDAARARPRVVLLTESVNPLALVQAMDRVYVVSSQLGFEALLFGKPVSCFGAPFYSGWGLTDDRVSVERRRRRRTVEELAAAAWLLYARYVHPVRGERCAAEDVVSHLELQRRTFEANRGTSVAVGFPAWKKAPTRAYLRTTEGRLRFEDRRFAPDSRVDRVVLWGRGLASEGPRAAASVPVVRMEDGFLRSVGLGSDIVDPLSLVVDGRGLYYDPSAPSDLEELLATRAFSDAELTRARALRRSIVEARLSKYNFGATSPFPALRDSGRRRLLVPGQVEEDASVVLGGAGIRSNSELVRRVREENPDALLVYKPHPDVVSGNRRGKLSAAAQALVDVSVVDCSLAQCLEHVHEVHTLTSLVGFEALLRERPVVTYGQPFYASWGLTKDYAPLARRTRKLALDELVFGALVLYPRYYSFRVGAFVEVEDIVFELVRGLGATSVRLSRSRVSRQLTRLGRVLGRLVRAR